MTTRPEITSERLNPDWITKIQAAHTIGVVLKTVEQLAKKGHLRQATWRRPTGPALVVYRAEDVATVAANWPKRRTGATLVTPGDAPALNARPQPETTALALADRVAQILRNNDTLHSGSESESRYTPSQKRFLTLSEASEYSGLSEAYLRRQCQSGWPGALKDRGWKLRRSDVEAL